MENKKQSLKLKKVTILLLDSSKARVVQGGSLPTITMPRISCKIACSTEQCPTPVCHAGEMI